MWLVTPKQERSDVVTVWDEAKAFALPVGCVDHVPPSQENLGKDHFTLKLAGKVVKGGLATPSWQSPGTLRSHVSCACQMTAVIMADVPRPYEWSSKSARIYGSSKPTSAKLIHIDLNSLLVPKRFHAPRFAQYRDKSFNESTSHVHVRVRWNLSNCYRFNTHHQHIFRFPTLTCLLKLVRSIKRSADKKCESEYWRRFHKTAAHFFRRRGWHIRMFERNANAGRCLWISPAQRLY